VRFDIFGEIWVKMDAGEYLVRRLERKDVDEKYFELLSDLTVAPVPEKERVDRLFSFMERHAETYHVFVVVQKSTQKIVGSGTLLVEHKFIRDLGKVGHIEDIVVLKEMQGEGLGKALVEHLAAYASEKGCYKTILACSEQNAAFYEKCGFVRKEIEMAMYHKG